MEKIKLKVYRDLPLWVREAFDRCVDRSIDLQYQYKHASEIRMSFDDLSGWDFIGLVGLASQLLGDNLRLKEQEEQNGK